MGGWWGGDPPPQHFATAADQGSGLRAFENMTARTGTNSEKKPHPLTVQRLNFAVLSELSVVGSREIAGFADPASTLGSLLGCLTMGNRSGCRCRCRPQIAGGDFRNSTRARNTISRSDDQTRLALRRSVRWDKVYALIFNSEAMKRQSRFLPARKGECAKASIVHEHVVNRNGRRAESGVRRT